MLLLRLAGIALIAIGAAAIVATLYFSLTWSTLIAWKIAAVLAVVGIGIAALMLFLIGAPTLLGSRVLSRIKGFKLYLETAEKERLNFVGEPQMTVARFETILPYAIALGVEKPWTERFESELARHAIADASSGYSPSWHHGTNFNSGTMSRDIAALSSGMSAAMIAAQPASSSSSGFSGGGGSSGGGGGGGGGGGW